MSRELTVLPCEQRFLQNLQLCGENLVDVRAERFECLFSLDEGPQVSGDLLRVEGCRLVCCAPDDVDCVVCSKQSKNSWPERLDLPLLLLCFLKKPHEVKDIASLEWLCLGGSSCVVPSKERSQLAAEQCGEVVCPDEKHRLGRAERTHLCVVDTGWLGCNVTAKQQVGGVGRRVDQSQLLQDREDQRDRDAGSTDSRGHVAILERFADVFPEICHERRNVWLPRDIEVQVFGQPGESVQLAQTRATGEQVVSILRMVVDEGQNLVLQGLFQSGAQEERVEARA